MSTATRRAAYWQLVRGDRPVGFLLLLWPTLWALWLASNGPPPGRLLAIFIAGTWLMRAAGCAINDYADRHFDGHVERTKGRPLPTGALRAQEALAVAAVLALGAATLVALTNLLTMALAVVGAALAALYPFTKRWLRAPQLVLGAAFAWGVPMAYSAVQNSLPPPQAWGLYVAVLLWVVSYDTFYAMVDREDDRTLGIGSTALWFERADLLCTALLQLSMLTLLGLLGYRAALGEAYSAALVATAALFSYQHWLARRRDGPGCLRAFLNNHWVGAVVFVGLAVALA